MRQGVIPRLDRPGGSLNAIPLVVALTLVGLPYLPAHSRAITYDTGQTVLIFMQPEEATGVLASHVPAGVDAKSRSENRLLAACSAGGRTKGSSDRKQEFAWSKQLVQLVLSRLSERLSRQIAKYSSLIERQESVDFYQAVSAASAREQIELSPSCLRFAHAELGTHGELEVVFDFVARLRMAESNDAVIIEPMRLVVSRPAVKTGGDAIGVAIGIQAESVWRGEARGYKEIVWNEVLLQERVDPAHGPAVHYFNSTDTQGTRLPLPPISVAVDSTRPFGRIKVRMSAAQVGSIPTSLELLADALLVEPDTKGNLLYIAARKQLEN